MEEETAPQALVLSCMPADYDAATGVCAAPFYSYPSSGWPTLTADEGLQIAAAIAGCWTLGLIARLIIRSGQGHRYSH